MKDVYIIMAFHAHELLWDLPKILLSFLDEDNPMKGTFLDENYIKKRDKEDRNIYTLYSRLGDVLNAPLCVEYSNELLSQIREVLPDTFEKLKEDYQRGRLYPLYGHAHHTHVSLLREEEITQETVWNMEYLHGFMGVPYPKYKGLFPTEASLSYDKMEGIVNANIDYVIFPHLEKEKVPFKLIGKSDYKYKPFLIRTPQKNILALPRNFPISQEIWRPITKMKRDAVKAQGYKLGDYPVFKEEYLYDEVEDFPIDMEQGVEIYKEVLRRELNDAPSDGVLVYIQDLELMDFGDTAIEIMEKAWKDILIEDEQKYKVHFVIPDEYIDRVVKAEGIENLPELKFHEITWSPEIRLVLRVDGHYPPIGVTGVGRYDTKKTGLYDHPHIFWENGKYFCGIFDSLLDIFNLSIDVPVRGTWMNDAEYELYRNNPDVQILLYHRLMKRACNWGWRPTEGRQKLPYLKGFLICSLLLKKLEDLLPSLILNRQPKPIDSRNIVALAEVLKIFIDGRLDYLRYGMDKLTREKRVDLTNAYAPIESVYKWKDKAIEKAGELYRVNKSDIDFTDKLRDTLFLLRDYCQAVFMSTDYIQRIWSEIEDVEFMVDKMYEYLYDIYPPRFPGMIEKIDNLKEKEIERYFAGRDSWSDSSSTLDILYPENK